MERDCYTGMRLQVSADGTVTWQPSKDAGRHGATFIVKENEGLADMVLDKRPKGSTVKVTRDGGVLCYENQGPSLIGKIPKNPGLDFVKLDANPSDISPGRLWVGPFAGEQHHFCDDRFWVKNIHNKRCHYNQVPQELKSSIERLKPVGGSFAVNPWGHVIALVRVNPMPEDAEKVWNTLSREEKRLLQIKKMGARMIPIYICRWDEEWDVQLDDPVDFSKPLTKEEEKDTLSFLALGHSIPKKPDNTREGGDDAGDPEAGQQEPETEEYWSDDDEWHSKDALDLVITPSETDEVN